MHERTRKTEPCVVDGIYAAGERGRALGTFGRYRLLALLGEGGMGAVYRAYDPQLDREVALKLLTRRKGRDGASESGTHHRRERLLREGRFAARVRHPAVVAIYETGEIDGRVYLAQELVDGASLRDVLEASVFLGPAEALAIVRGIAEGLGAVHAAGLIHRDIKPENILLGSDGRVRITDFGAAREAGRVGKNETGLYVGTPEYSSPEQCVSDDLDGRSDLYSLGVVLFELLSGTVPHEGESPVELLGKIMSTEAPRLGTVLPDLSPAIDAMTARMLARKRLDRYSTAAELLADLDEIEHAPQPGPASAPVRLRRRRSSARPLPSTRRGRRAGNGRRLARRGLSALLIGAVTALTAAAGGAWAWWVGGSEARAEAHAPQAGDARAVVVDAAGGTDASLIGTALRRKLADRRIDTRSGPLMVTVREFPHSRNVVVELTHNGRRIGRMAYTATADMVGAVVGDVLAWIEAELARVAPATHAPVLPVSQPRRAPDSPPANAPGAAGGEPDADGTSGASDAPGEIPPA